MKAWVLQKLGGMEHLLLVTDYPDPVPAGDEVVVELAYAALNPADRYLIEGQYPARPTFPHVLGRDGIGKVVAIGADVTETKIGDTRLLLRGEAGVNRPGTFAERVAVPERYLVPPPAGWTKEESAGAALVYCTAYQAMTMWGELPASAVVLVTGASGGVGVATVQLAKSMGYTVVALSRSDAKQEQLRKLGADFTFDPHDTQWRRRLMDTSQQVDLAIDNIGGPLFNELLGTLAEHGRISCIGRLAGPVPQFNTASLFFRRIRVGGVAVGSYSNAEAQQAWASVLTLLAQTGSKPLVDRVFTFSDLPAAFDRLTAGPMGKVLLKVR